MAAAAVAVCWAILWLLGAREWSYFVVLRETTRGGAYNPKLAQHCAEKLAATERGVNLALGDISVVGGDAWTWSSRIVANTRHKAYVETRLGQIAANSDHNLSQRLEALALLWERTGERKHLETMFSMVRGRRSSDAVQSAILGGRMRLAGLVNWRDISFPRSDEPVNITLEELREHLSRQNESGY